ncbi:EscU/YscU/HrcU family type III secretion system export apparatus switch protein [Micavibrio aeruginosavorus]|uniref:Flagellar protein FhlB n=1 Tax=Micavibrio aeruginosavorus (strain ARL-13) TaxID=856793 RepID=G2KRQ8_MICAA|nr:EscU/YscU/HrcU family type III secretion system export apparatus switch protein [Micavibrio aeruginosavorus]AEP10016.1 putative uncharacterized protein [Micavibrio aeruginosavorus ARL-13]
MADYTENGGKKPGGDPLKPLNLKEKTNKRAAAVAISATGEPGDMPTISAAGRGKIAEQILQLAFANGVRVREDSALAEMLVALEVDSPIPTEAIMAVAEVLCYVYRANGEPNPFDAILQDDMQEPGQDD